MAPKRKPKPQQQQFLQSSLAQLDDPPKPISKFTFKALLHKAPRGTSQMQLGPDIEDMLFGFGDAWPANAAVVHSLEDLVIAYIRDLTLQALRVAACRPRGKLDKECFLFLVRKEAGKFKRVHHLLNTNEELKAAKKIDIAVDSQIHHEEEEEDEEKDEEEG